MRDFPMFTTEHGVASITLKEIPYKGIAYIKIQSTQQTEIFLKECVDFCKMAGAEDVYASGMESLAAYPLHTTILQMRRPREGLPETDAALFPLTEKAAEQWRGIYNERMMLVPNSSTMTRLDIQSLIKRGGGYFVHRGGELLGIGIARGDTVETVIGVKPGAGREVMLALCNSLASEMVVLEVASTNLRARKLYEKLGFITTCEISSWYHVLTRKNT